MTCPEDLAEILRRFGPEGDNSFEYLGLVLDAERVIDRRVYRTHRRKAVEPELDEPYRSILQRARAASRRSQEVTVCDFAEDRAKGQTRYKISLYLPRFDSLDDTERFVNEFLQPFARRGEKERMLRILSDAVQYGVSEPTALMQIGLCCGRDGSISELKYYYRTGKPAPGEEPLPQRFRMFSQKPWYDQSRAQALALAEGDFHPIFIGVNDDGAEQEQKLYFLSSALGINRRSLFQQQFQLMKALTSNAPYVTEAWAADFFHAGLYIQGAAISNLYPDVIRLYFSTCAGSTGQVKA